jgi:glycosyltransferase involved in cell wall biosynthesis
VRFYGWVERERLSELFARSSVLVLPSTWNEPFGLVGLEAMAHARPVIAFDVGGIQDWLLDGYTGLLVKDIGPGPLASAILRLWSDPEKAREMGRQGLARVNQLFTLEKHVDTLVAEFENLKLRAPVLQ